MKNQFILKRSVVYTLITSSALLGAVDANASFWSSMRNAFSGMSRTLQQTYNKGIDGASDFAKDLGSNLADAGRDLAGSTVGAAQDLNNDLNALGNRAYGTAAAGIDEVNNAKNVLNDANNALAQADSLYNAAISEAERLARAELDRLLEAAFRDLKRANLDELANVQKIGDGDFWMNTVINAVASDITGLPIAQQIKDTALDIKNGMGTPTAEYPFGNGKYGKAALEQTEMVLNQALLGAKGIFSPLDPRKIPLGSDPGNARVFANYFPFDLPEPLKFKYEIAFQVKPFEFSIPIEIKKAHLADGKIAATFKLPMVYGNWKGENTAFDDIFKKKKFNFQVAVSGALATTKKQDDTFKQKHKAEEQLSFDVSCSTITIGQCQLRKIGLKTKFEAKSSADQTNNFNFSLTVAAINGLLEVMQNPLAESVLFGSDGNKKREYKNTLEEIKGYIDMAYSITMLTKPPTRQAASVGLALMDDMGLSEPLAGFVNVAQDADILMNALYKYAGKIEGNTKEANEYFGKRKTAYEENVSSDMSVVFQFLNDDAMKGNFVAGWKPTERTRTEGLAQTVGLELGMGANSEIKLKIGADDGYNVTTGMSLESRASFGVTFPLHKQASRYLRDLEVEEARVTPAELATAYESAGNDPYNIGASQNWDKLEDSQLSSQVARADVLTLPTFIAIQAR
jgi:hypothetical protein